MSKDLQSVIGIVLDPLTRHVLLVKRRDVPIWVLPGGGVDSGESLEDAVVREVLEETGLQTKVIKILSHYTPINKLSFHTFVYLCEPISGELTKGDETANVGYYPIDNLPSSFFYIHKGWLMETLKLNHQFFSRPLNEITYFKLFCYFCKHPLEVIQFLFTLLRNKI